LISRDYLKIKQKLKFSIDKMSSERGEIRYCTPQFTYQIWKTAFFAKTSRFDQLIW